MAPVACLEATGVARHKKLETQQALLRIQPMGINRRVAQVACLQATWVAQPEEVEVIRPLDWVRLHSDFYRLSW